MIARKLLLGAWLLVAASGCEDAEDPAATSEDGDPATEEHVPAPALDASVPEDAGPEAPEPEVTKVRVSPTSGLSTSEGGSSASFTVELTARPTAEVSIRLFSTAEQEGVPDHSELVFTPDAWRAQTVTVTGQNDALLDGSVLYQIVLDETVSDDLRYQSVPVSDVTILNIDDDAPGFTILKDEGASTSEYGETATLHVQLNTRPSAAVTLTFVSDDPQEGTVAADPLTFLPRNWNVPQPLLVTGVDDSDGDGSQPYHVIVATVTSDDLDYRDLTGEAVELLNLDDDTPGITLDGVYENEVDEDARDYLRFRLATRPSATVSVTCRSSNPQQLRIYPETIRFYGFEWDAIQQFTLDPGDERDDGDQQVVITCDPTVSDDPAYAGIEFEPQVLRVIDNDVSDVRAIASGTRTCEATGSFCCINVNVSLGATPSSGDVVISVMSSDPSEGLPDRDTVTISSLRFPTTVKVCGVDDSEDDGDVPYTVTLAVQSSDDPAFQQAAPVVLSLTNRDND